MVAPGARDSVSRLSASDRPRFRHLERLAEPLPLPALPADWGERVDALGLEFPSFRAALARVRDELALLAAVGASTVRLRPLLLVGPPGIGKTRFGRRLAEGLGLGFGAISVAGQTDNRMLEGTARGWATTEPSWPVGELARLGTAGPLLLVDEVDKAVPTRNGSAHHTLLAWLEPSTARDSRDALLGAPVDLSRVSWLLAANTLSGLPAALLSRLRVAHVEAPPEGAFAAVLRGVLDDLATELGCPAWALPALAGAEVAWLRARWRETRSPRILRKLAERILGAAARRAPAGEGRTH